MSVAAMVLGIVGLTIFWLPIVGPVVALAGVILGIIALIRKSGNKAFGLIGLVIGLVGLIVGVTWSIVIIWGGNEIFDQLNPDQADIQSQAEIISFS